ncbi:MAG: capsular biosynthesis protein [Candidatus Cloacimonetes bacterium]|nr:capsular biosynthesis protein [Candidatus Cloacimonadota bacterium]
MIDIHCHILHQIDDGSTELTQSVKQLKLMESGGVSDVYLTSHYFRGHYQYSREEYDAKLKSLQEAATAEGLKLNLHAGFEVFVQPGIIDDIAQKNLCLGKSNYVLIESELNGLPVDFYQNVYPLLRAGYKPILAHAERYVSIMKRPSKARELSDRDIYIQCNAGAFLGHYGDKVKHTAWELLNNGWVHFIASDDHVRMEYGALFEAAKRVEERIDKTTRNLMFREYPARIGNGETIPYSYVIVKKPSKRRRKSVWRRLFG